MDDFDRIMAEVGPRRVLHSAADYDRVIYALVMEDRAAHKKRKISHARIRRELGLSHASNNVVVDMLNATPWLRKKWENFLQQHHTQADYEKVIDALIAENIRAGKPDEKIFHADIARKLKSKNKSGVSHFLTGHPILRKKYEHWLIQTNQRSARLKHQLPVAAE